jgi:hypothetical protein
MRAKTLELTTSHHLFELAPSDFGLSNETIEKIRFGNQSVAGDNYACMQTALKRDWI